MCENWESQSCLYVEGSFHIKVVCYTFPSVFYCGFKLFVVQTDRFLPNTVLFMSIVMHPYTKEVSMFGGH